MIEQIANTAARMGGSEAWAYVNDRLRGAGYKGAEFLALRREVWTLRRMARDTATAT